MSPRRVRDLLDRIGGVHDPCDLDLLIFFHRHPRAVLTSERLALYVGHELSRVAKSLEALIEAGLLTRLQRPTGTARMYVLTSGGPCGGWLEALLRLVSTREGRLAALKALTPRPTDSAGPDSPVAGALQGQRTRAWNAKELRHA